MTARDDYPYAASLLAGSFQGVQVFAEIDRLRQWKAEALIVLDNWDRAYEVAEALGYGALIGDRKSGAVANALLHLPPRPSSPDTNKENPT